MPTIFDVKPNKLIEKASQELKKLDPLKMPDWAMFVKTGMSKERPPLQNDWWYLRSASILRKVYLKGPVGVSKLRTKYGSRKNRGYKPDRFYKASGKVIRIILQQLEKAEFIQAGDKGVHKGKIITPKGKSFLDRICKGAK